MSRIIKIDEARVKDHLGTLVRKTVKETLNEMLDVEAENYGHEGPNKSYSVRNATEKAKLYHTLEPVPIELIGADGNRRRSGQAVKLGAEEWTAYTVNSPTPQELEGVVRVKAESLPAVFECSINGRAQDLAIETGDWVELRLKAVRFSEGTNRLRLRVKQGTVQFDWLDFK